MASDCHHDDAMKATAILSRAVGILVAGAVIGLLTAQVLGACTNYAYLAETAGAGGQGAVGGQAPGGQGGESFDAGWGLYRILVTPNNDILEVDLGTEGSQTFVATGYYRDGAVEDVSDEAEWNSTTIGGFDGSTLQIPPADETGAVTTMVTASLEGVQGLAQLTVVTYRLDTDFFFFLPYEDEEGPQQKPLDFSTDVKSLDLFFAMDTTGSMDEEIANLQAALSFLVIPNVRNLVADSWFGAGAFMDFPVDGYGAEHGTDCGNGGLDDADQPFRLFQELTGNVAHVQAGVDALSDDDGYAIGCGGSNDRPESLIEAVYQVATGEGLLGPGLTSVPANDSGVGGVGFRQGSMPVVVPISDAPSHTIDEGAICDRPPPIPDFDMDYDGDVLSVAHTRAQTKDALNGICAKVVGVSAIDTSLNWPDNCFSLTDSEDLATATETRVPPEAWDVPARPAGCDSGECCTGFYGEGRAPDTDGLCPLVFKVDQNGTGLSQSISKGMEMLTRYAAFDVVTGTFGEEEGIYGEQLPSGTTTADFIQDIDPDSFDKPPPPPELPDPVITADGFDNVTPGTVVTFQVTAYNDFVEQTNVAQFFLARIRVLAGGCTELDEREVFILVPPLPFDPPE